MNGSVMNFLWLYAILLQFVLVVVILVEYAWAKVYGGDEAC